MEGEAVQRKAARGLTEWATTWGRPYGRALLVARRLQIDAVLLPHNSGLGFNLPVLPG